ncbi:MAG: hypothetical protein PHF67_05575, partial [Candidatus Nanoarchaeia archaeon]|nr:hypothetical protein [Candidatus Nanoarchaeia archaeon]
GIACTTDSCDPATGTCLHPLTGCDDSNLCTTDSCNADGTCSNTAINCDDSDACTLDSCDPANGNCVHALMDCDDANLCNGLESCDSTVGCIPGTPLTCNDGNACTSDGCVPATGCVYTPISGCGGGGGCTPNCAGKSCGSDGCGGSCGSCPSGDACTTYACANNKCKSTTKNCDDSNSCTDDSCSPAFGCVNTPKSCSDGDICTDDSCESSTGNCIHTYDATNDASCTCIPNCNGNECGDDGCGGSCGSCSENQCCDNRKCIDEDASNPECCPEGYTKGLCPEEEPPREPCKSNRNLLSKTPNFLNNFFSNLFNILKNWIIGSKPKPKPEPQYCCLGACGDGKVDVGEKCDDGNTESGDGCSSECKIERCGNGKIDEITCPTSSLTTLTALTSSDKCYEKCDDGDGADDDDTVGSCDGCDGSCDLVNSNTLLCSLNCEPTYCGDGEVQNPDGQGIAEECDPGKHCLYSPDPLNPISCKEDKDCDSLNIDTKIICNKCVVTDTKECTKDCKCEGETKGPWEETCQSEILSEKDKIFPGGGLIIPPYTPALYLADSRDYILRKRTVFTRNYKDGKCLDPIKSEESENTKFAVCEPACQKCDNQNNQKINVNKVGDAFRVDVSVENNEEDNFEANINYESIMGGMDLKIFPFPTLTNAGYMILAKSNRDLTFIGKATECGLSAKKIKIEFPGYYKEIIVYLFVKCRCEDIPKKFEFDNYNPKACIPDTKKLFANCVQFPFDPKDICGKVSYNICDKNGKCKNKCEAIESFKNIKDYFGAPISLTFEGDNLDVHIDSDTFNPEAPHHEEIKKITKDFCSCMKDMSPEILSLIPRINIFQDSATLTLACANKVWTTITGCTDPITGKINLLHDPAHFPFCSNLNHEATHTKTFIGEDDILITGWLGLVDTNFYYYTLTDSSGNLRDLTLPNPPPNPSSKIEPDSSGFFKYKDGSTGAQFGFLEPYGAKDILEDIATFAEMISGGPTSVDWNNLFNTHSYKDTYKAKFNLICDLGYAEKSKCDCIKKKFMK